MIRALALAALLASSGLASAQVMLHWKPRKEHPSWTVLYGEVTVLAEKPDTSFCGVDWWASHPAAGTTGFDFQSSSHRKIFFSVWPTDKQDNAFPHVAQTNSKVGTVHASNDVHGAHCELEYGWQPGHTYQFYLTKRNDETGGGTVVSLYFFDEAMDRWVGEGRILSPIDGKSQVPNFDGALTSSLTDLLGNRDPDNQAPRLALYRLWAGTAPSDLAEITEAEAGGLWGTMNGAFYLAMGDDLAVSRAMAKYLGPNGHVQPGRNKEKMQIPAEPVPENVVRALEQLR